MQETLLNVASSVCDTWTSGLFPFMCASQPPEFASAKNRFGKLAMFRESITCMASSNRVFLAMPEVAASLLSLQS